MEKEELIRQIALFRGLDSADLRRLGEIATEERLGTGQEIFAEGTPGDSLFAVKYGTVRVLKQGREGKEEVARMSSGEHFGEMALIDSLPRSATVDTVERTELVQIRREDLENLLAQDDALGHRVYKAFARYLCLRLQQTTIDLTFMREIAKRPHR
jgi:CRP-like cAMP-binding protein